MAEKKSRGRPGGQSIGGMLVGVEQAVLRTLPPGHELVHHARPDDPVPAGDGSLLVIDVPPPIPGVGAQPATADPVPSDTERPIGS
jgi:hypothetical protein